MGHSRLSTTMDCLSGCNIIKKIIMALLMDGLQSPFRKHKPLQWCLFVMDPRSSGLQTELYQQL
uniref:Uncharacterized protein n=1 Tax=Rhizophora mucronata TaxID=61149 RepID=A0A2P2QIC2_RHIMU